MGRGPDGATGSGGIRVNQTADILGRGLPAAMQLGTAASALLMLIGLATGQSTIVWDGLLVLTLTPVLQLAVAAVGFGRLREPRASLVAGTVLVLLLAALVTATLVARGQGA
jgi:uncharacterized membrane protein